MINRYFYTDKDVMSQPMTLRHNVILYFFRRLFVGGGMDTYLFSHN